MLVNLSPNNSLPSPREPAAGVFGSRRRAPAIARAGGGVFVADVPSRPGGLCAAPSGLQQFVEECSGEAVLVTKFCDREWRPVPAPDDRDQ